jgi:hypothetical protein
MRVIIGAVIGFIGIGVVAAQALTVDDIIKLKRAGVADSTIELLIKGVDDSRSAGVWRQDGWIVHSTPTRALGDDANAHYRDDTFYIYPRVFFGRR